MFYLKLARELNYHRQIVISFALCTDGCFNTHLQKIQSPSILKQHSSLTHWKEHIIPQVAGKPEDEDLNYTCSETLKTESLRVWRVYF